MTNGSLPNITGDINTYCALGANGCFSPEQYGPWGPQGTASQYAYWHVNIDASRSSGVYWRTDNEVHPKNLGLYYIIKY